MCANGNTHPTATRCSVLGENVKQKTCTSVDWDWYNDMSPVNIFHVTTWPFSSPLAMKRRCPATDQWAVVSLCWNHSQIHKMHCVYTTLHHMCHNTTATIWSTRKLCYRNDRAMCAIEVDRIAVAEIWPLEIIQDGGLPSTLIWCNWK